jgi:hypothetical protein
MLPPLSSPGDRPPQGRSGRKAFTICDIGLQGGGYAAAGSRPGADTGGGLPPIDSCEWWPSASDPQPTTTPADSGGISAAGPRLPGGPPCLPIGNGPIALDRSSEPAGKTRGVKVTSGPRSSDPRCGHGEDPKPGKRAEEPALAEHALSRDRRRLLQRRRASTRWAGSSCGTNPGPCLGELQRRGALPSCSPLWFGVSRKPTPGDAPWRHQSRSSPPVS